eukprot:4433510-Ditylum_brightwellii.AAC.1
MEVDSKWNSPSIATCADNFGFILHGLKMLSIRFACGIKLHQKLIGKSAGMLASPVKKWHFH